MQDWGQLADWGMRSGERRSQMRIVFPERRTGYDRRSLRSRYQGGLYSLGRSAAQLTALTLSLVLLGAADFGLTLAALQRGGTELNPVMGRLFDVNPMAAGAFKAGVLALVIVAVWKLRRYRRVIELALATLAIHLAVFIYHLANFAVA